jgi:hypothetical protein
MGEYVFTLGSSPVTWCSKQNPQMLSNLQKLNKDVLWMELNKQHGYGD